MEYNLADFIDEAIKLELQVADIYTLFSESIPKDAFFWSTLAWEEKNHAAVLKTGKDVLLPVNQFPGEVLPSVIQVLIDTNVWLHSLKQELTEIKPDRNRAFEIALKIESSAGEQHFQRVMESSSESPVIKIFQELCEDDIHHLNRIHEYIKKDSELEGISDADTRKILIVIPDNLVAKLLKTILESEGHVDIAEDGRDGMVKLSDEDYDLIISAIEMPFVDGITFYKEGKKRHPDLNRKILYFVSEPSRELSSFFEDEDIRYLTKPSTIDDIRSISKNILWADN